MPHRKEVKLPRILIFRVVDSNEFLFYSRLLHCSGLFIDSRLFSLRRYSRIFELFLTVIMIALEKTHSKNLVANKYYP